MTVNLLVLTSGLATTFLALFLGSVETLGMKES